MAIREFELFHGAVLTKLVRNDRPVRLTMIETAEDARSVYTVNDTVFLYIKHSKSPKKDNDGCLTWTFTFSVKRFQEIREYRRQMNVFIALVCGQSRVDQGQMEVCLLDPDKIDQSLNLHAAEQAVDQGNV